jgi:hypothetical protein
MRVLLGRSQKIHIMWLLWASCFCVGTCTGHVPTTYNKYAYITIPNMVDVRSFLWYSSEDSYKNCILNISFSFYSMGGGGT